MREIKNIVYSLVGIVLVIAIGTLGYTSLENLSPIDAVYFTIVTISSVGYGDFYPKTPEGKIFTVFIILTGLLLLFYLISALVSSLVEVGLSDILRLRKIEDELKKMKNHTILCGYGDVGTLMAENLGKENLVIIEKNEERYHQILEDGYIGIHGNSTQTKTLEAAGIKKAKSIVIALNSDADAVYTILAAKEQNPEIKVYVRANEADSEKKMKLAGADYVICLPVAGSNELLKAMGIKPKTC